MNRKERAAVIELYTESLRVNRDSTRRYPDPTYQFNHGYEWGIAQTLAALGISQTERYELWEAITFPKGDSSG